MKQIIAFILLFCISASAQQTNRVPVDDVGKTLERCLIEVEHLRAICRSPEQVAILEAKLKAANDLLAVYKTQATQQANTAQARTTAGAARVAGYESRIKEYEERLAISQTAFNKLSKENRHLRKTRNIVVGIVIGLGVGLAWALGK